MIVIQNVQTHFTPYNKKAERDLSALSFLIHVMNVTNTDDPSRKWDKHIE